MLTQLNPPLPMTTPKGAGLCHFCIDYGPEHNLIWVVGLRSNGEIWCFENSHVRLEQNYTFGRPSAEPAPQADVPFSEPDFWGLARKKTLWAGGSPDKDLPDSIGMRVGPHPDRNYIIHNLDDGDVLVECRDGNTSIVGIMQGGQLVAYDPSTHT